MWRRLLLEYSGRSMCRWMAQEALSPFSASSTACVIKINNNALYETIPIQAPSSTTSQRTVQCLADYYGVVDSE